MNPKCNKCNDTGRVQIETSPEDFGNGITMLAGTMPILCECRKAMPRVHGKASWWSMEHAKTITVPPTILEARIDIEVELPISEDNRPLVCDASNFYWPSCAKVEIESDSLCSFELRDIAAGLIKAADQMDAIDKARRELAAPVNA